MQHVIKKTVIDVDKEKVVSLHKVRSSLIPKIDNPVLRTLIESGEANLRLDKFHIDLINHAHASKLGNKSFKKLLQRAGIFLTKQQSKQVNDENKQIFYRNSINNAALRDLLKDARLNMNRLHFLAKNQIEVLNILLLRPVGPEALDILLKKLGVTLSKIQLQRVADESQAINDASPYFSARNDCEVLRLSLLHFDLKSTKRQFSGYLSLIMNESALSGSEVSQLKVDLTYVEIEKSGSIHVENPYMAKVKEIHRSANRLHERRLALSLMRESTLHNRLIDDIDKVLLRIAGKDYELLFRQKSALERWANISNISDVLHSEIKRLASSGILPRSKAILLLGKLHRKSLFLASSQ